jgi:hypothetical protein
MDKLNTLAQENRDPCLVFNIEIDLIIRHVALTELLELAS